ncbi:hypothetical protein J6590_001190, partial [Homalodisca vitripennis]
MLERDQSKIQAGCEDRPDDGERIATSIPRESLLGSPPRSVLAIHTAIRNCDEDLSIPRR